MKFALFSGSAPQWTPAELAAKLAEDGWDGVEWRVTDQKPAAEPGFWAGNLATFPLTGLEDRLDEIAGVTASAGIDIAGLAGYVAISDLENAERIISATAQLGVQRVRLNVPKAAPGSDYDALFAATRTAAREVAAIAGRYGVQVVLQIHHGNIVSTASAALRLLDGLDPAHIGVIHDLGNLTIEGREGLQSHTPGLQIIRDYLAHVHVKNAAWRPGQAQEDGTIDWAWEWAPLKTGAGDVPGYIASLVEVGYDGWVTVEDFTTEVPLEQRLREDLGYLRSAYASAREREAA